MELISAKYLLTLTNGDEPLEDGAIAVELGKIEAVGKLQDLRKQFPTALVTNHNNHVLMPGLVNAHCHLDLVSLYEKNKPILKELPESADYIDWLISLINFRKNVTSQELMRGIQKGVQVSFEAGTTCIGDATTFEGTYNIVDEMGIRAVVYNEIYSGKGGLAQELFENALALSEKYFDPCGSSRISSGLSPTATYLLSKNLLNIIAKHAQNSSMPLKIHASESFAEMEFFFDSKGTIGEKLFPAIGWGEELPPSHKKTPISYLSEIGFLAASPAIIGGLHLSENCLKLLARNMCRIIFSPTNSRFFGHGTPPLEKLRKSGIPVGLGTGSPARTCNLSMWDEMREVLRVAEAVVTPKEIMQMATVGSARAMNMENQIGTFAKGKQADYIVVDLPPGYDIDPAYIYGALIKNTNAGNVKKVAVQGDLLKNV